MNSTESVLAPAILALAILLSMAPRARADDSNRARALFREGRALMAEGKYEEACPKLEGSQSLDPGVGTQFNLARCYELSGRLASAWDTYTLVMAATHAAGQPARESITRERLEALAPRLSYAILVRAPNDASEVQVARDGTLLSSAALRVALPLDRGMHEIRVSAPGKREWQTRVVITSEHERITVEVPVLEDVAPSPAEAAPPPQTSATRDAGDTGPRIAAGAQSHARMRTQRVVALVAFGASLVALGAGTYFGLHAMSLGHDADGDCDASGCNPKGYTARQDSQHAGNLATLAFATGGVLAVAAGVLWFTAPAPRSDHAVQIHPALGTSSAGLVLGGRWQ
ncbi:MAG TPA: hypothetical protein VNO21_16705 [Polyangiaceae bacterium]|nr:hypothetical protein [Polyangiaceae bacterium]